MDWVLLSKVLANKLRGGSQACRSVARTTSAQYSRRFATRSGLLLPVYRTTVRISVASIAIAPRGTRNTWASATRDQRPLMSTTGMPPHEVVSVLSWQEPLDVILWHKQRRIKKTVPRTRRSSAPNMPASIANAAARAKLCACRNKLCRGFICTLRSSRRRWRASTQACTRPAPGAWGVQALLTITSSTQR